MPTIAGSHVPPPKSWDEFEDIALSAAKLRWRGSEFFRNGRAGQRQDGVDIFGQVNKTTIGIQCKNTMGGVSEHTILEEIRNAESFSPPLSTLYIATTSNRDSLLQEKVRILSLDRAAVGKFSVDLLFWNDVVFDLAKDEEEFFKHYPQFRYVQPAAPVQNANGQPTFSAEDMKIERHPAWGGRTIPRTTLAHVGGGVTFAGFTAILSTVLPSFFGRPSNWTPAAMLLFGLGMTFLAISSVLKTRKFEHLLLRRYYLELSNRDNLHINRLTATCPWCSSRMQLRNLGPKNGPKDDIFVCERNFKQHTILLDHTMLPALEH